MQHTSLFEDATRNKAYRRVVYTNKHCQLAMMNLVMGEESGFESIPVDQVLILLWGTIQATVAKENESVVAGDAICVPAGCPFNLVNTGKQDAKFIVVYAPSELRYDDVEVSKEESLTDPYKELDDSLA